jgi:glycosyltransferase involved in cell wall biosynthesis
MRILHVSECVAGGAGVLQVVRTLSSGLTAAGHEVAVAYGERAGEDGSHLEDLGRSAELFPIAWPRRTLADSATAGRLLKSTAKSWEPDVVHLHSSFAGAVGAFALRDVAPLVYSPHGYSFTMDRGGLARRGAFAFIERLVARRVDLVGAVSETEAAQAVRVAAAPRVVTVPNGIPELDQPATRCETPRDLVLAMGRVVPQRRPVEVARILGALGDVAQVMWVGGGEEASPALDALAASGVEVTGWLSHQRALQRLREAKVYLHWTAWDGLPLSILEAMANDVVVIASDIPANRELLGAEQVFSDVASAAAAIRAVIGDEEIRASLLEAQRRRRTRFGSKRMIERWESVYRQLDASAATAGACVR